VKEAKGGLKSGIVTPFLPQAWNEPPPPGPAFCLPLYAIFTRSSVLLSCQSRHTAKPHRVDRNHASCTH
jgi:hypothetical protein